MIALTASRTSTFYRPIAFLSLLLVSLFPDLSYPQPLPVPEGSRCAECGMVVDRNSKFIAEVVTADGKNMFFCDIGDMLVHFSRDRAKMKTVFVKDYRKGGWIDGKKAFYILDKKIATPMSWSIAAFEEESEAKKLGSAVDFNGAFVLLK